MTVKQLIIRYLEENKGWHYGGSLERNIADENGNKSSNVSRRCRELADEGKIERQLVTLNGLRVVQYRITSEERSDYKSAYELATML